MSKITLLADSLWVIRSTKTPPGGAEEVRYYESPAVWNKSPAHATIFRDFDIAAAHISIIHKASAPLGWADGSREVLDAVPLHGALVQKSSGTP